jgi:ligand-binding sensor domain-containing protein/signal transduction histidine kinase
MQRAPALAVLIFALLGAGADAAEYSHRVWRTEDGLPQNRVQAIAQTPDGYLWVGTSEGLARFDGSRFAIFDRSNTPAISDDSILSLEAVQDGTLWIGTEGGGLLHYSKGRFVAFGQKDGITNGFIRALHRDSGGTLWVGTDRGLFRSGSGSKYERVDGTPEVPLASVVSIAEDAAGRTWASTGAGLLVFDTGRLRRAPCNGRRPGNGALTISSLREGLLSDGCGVPSLSLPSLPINALHKDSTGNLWIGTIGKGLVSIDLKTGQTTDYHSPAVLPDNTVFLLFEDRQHNIWAAAQDGLVRLSRAVVTTLGAQDGLADDNVSTTYEDGTGVLWMVTFSGQIYRLEGDRPERFYLPEPVRGLRFRNVFRDSRGDYWFGTAGAGAVRLSHGLATHYTKSDGLRSDSIRQIFEDSKGQMWFATGSGLSRWSDGNFRNYYLEDGLSYPSVRCLGELSGGDLLAGTDAGLNRIHEGRIVSDPAFASLKQEKIWSLYVDGKNVWVGTRGGGLVLIRDGKTTRFTTRDGLVSNSIYMIVDDRAGQLWISSPVGVFSLRKAELDAAAFGNRSLIHAIAYGTSDGMATGQMYGGMQPAGTRRASGALWFPSVRGAVRLDPLHLPAHSSGPVVIESVSASDTPLPLSDEVTIPPGRGTIQIDFTACNLIAPQQVSFRYKLEGFDDSWTTAVRPRSAYYSNLPPGHYTFRVVAEDTGGIQSSSEASLLLFRKPAFHQTAWFYLIMLALLLMTLWAGLWLYTRQTRARFALLLNERTRLAREMHDTVIQGCVGVATLLEAVPRFQRNNLAEAEQLLSHARDQIRETIEEARQAVWNLRHSAAGRSPIVDLFELAQKLGKENGVVVETSIDGARVPLDPAIERTVLLVGREALRNAISHGAPGRILIHILFEDPCLHMEVRDDGRGFETGAQEPAGHFGIIGMRERVEQLGGSFSLESEPGSGAAITVSLPLRSEHSLHFAGESQNSTIPR